jgi:hypothetical protein
MQIAMEVVGIAAETTISTPLQSFSSQGQFMVGST